MKSGDAVGTTKLYHTIVGGVSHDAIGLTYSGSWGLMLAWIQLIVLGGATVFSKLPIRKCRRLGHGTLIAWAGLWLLNFYWLLSLDGEVSSFIQSGLMTTLFSCVVYRAFLSHKKISPTPSNPMIAEVSFEDPVDPDITESQPAVEQQSETRMNNVITHCRNAKEKCETKCAQTWKKVQPAASTAYVKAVDMVKKSLLAVKDFTKKHWPRVRDGHEDSSKPSDPVTQA